MTAERLDGRARPAASTPAGSSLAGSIAAWCAALASAAARAVLYVVATLGLVALVPFLGGASSTVVMSDSMAPGIQAGDVVVVRPVQPQDLRLGQVLLVDDPDHAGRLRLHRLVDMKPGELILKGDANPAADTSPVRVPAVHGVGVLRVPWIGAPMVWLREGRGDLVAAALLGAALLAALAASGVPGSRDRRRAAVAARAGAACLLLGGGLTLAPTHVPQSHAVFSRTTTSPTNILTTGTFTCPSRTGVPSASIYYSFMPASGIAETNLGTAGSVVDATLSAATLRRSGTCQGNNSPYLLFQAATPAYARTNVSFANNATSSGSASIWFKPTSRQGVLVGVGSSATTTASTTMDRQIYFTSTGLLGFAMRNGTTGSVNCTVSTTITLGTWHLAVDTFDASTNTLKLYLDGSATSCSVNDPAPQTTTGYGRVGGDAPLAANGGSAAVDGGIDEVATYPAVLSTTDVDTLWSLGH